MMYNHLMNDNSAVIEDVIDQYMSSGKIYKSVILKIYKRNRIYHLKAIILFTWKVVLIL